jgi:sulfhydrogenase subunit gamma (sulfur reductase)
MSPDTDQAQATQPPGGNLYAPVTMTIAEARQETYDVRTLRLEFPGEVERAAFFERYRVGMFGLYGLPGAGESVFCIASPPTQDQYIECTFRKAGRVTAAIQDREVGQTITFRGPYGNAFPIEEWKGKNILFIAGGIGLAPIRAVICNILDRRDEFGDLTILYGARTVADLVYKHELKAWQERSDVTLITTVDPGGETDDWKGEIGFVPAVLEKAAPSSKNAVALVCGPPIMLKFTLGPLGKLNFPDADAYTTLENRMKCGVGKCGRCNVGSLYVCKDGPVFTVEQVKKLPQDDL